LRRHLPRPSVIFRSDSNGEDLDGYAGAGLYESVPMDAEETVHADYSEDPLLWDPAFQVGPRGLGFRVYSSGD
jgi:alpha-glucan,water dikinase